MYTTCTFPRKRYKTWWYDPHDKESYSLMYLFPNKCNLTVSVCHYYKHRSEGIPLYWSSNVLNIIDWNYFCLRPIIENPFVWWPHILRKRYMSVLAEKSFLFYDTVIVVNLNLSHSPNHTPAQSSWEHNNTDVNYSNLALLHTCCC